MATQKDQLGRMADYNAKAGQKATLVRSLKKRVLTATIGALAEIELTFGHLWGQGSSEPLTDSQREWLAAYQQMRTAVLDRGNEQARALEKDFNQHHSL